MPRIRIREGALYRVQQQLGGISRNKLCRTMGVDATTGYRIDHGDRDPSAPFIAALILVSGLEFADLFTVEHDEAVA